ncbi:MAG: hypothetical protein LLG04_18665 [Parachlamydia sp.]|nr:hypothetical protein [Parachlamydia sp.]
MATLQDRLCNLIGAAVENQTSGSIIFKINPLNDFQILSTNYLQELNGNDEITLKNLHQLMTNSNMSKKEWIDSAQKVIKLINDFINEKRSGGGQNVLFQQAGTIADILTGKGDPRVATGNFFTFKQGADKLNYLEMWKKDYVAESKKFYYTKSGLNCLGNVGYSEADLSLLKGSESVELPPAAEMSCATYALLKAKSPLAKEVCHLYTSKSNIGDLKYWESKGFQQVEEPRPGDLVLYVHPKGNILHAGFVMPNLKVASKPGHEHPYAYLHNVYDFTGMYQWNVIFVRQEQNKPIAP